TTVIKTIENFMFSRGFLQLMPVWLLFKGPSIRCWYNNLARGSIITVENRLRTLGLVCETWGREPQVLLSQAKQDQRERLKSLGVLQ
ncbi:MAG: hypothetical protein QXR63_03420, partial [Candidatus Bathyarchaeia archaeon]